MVTPKFTENMRKKDPICNMNPGFMKKNYQSSKVWMHYFMFKKKIL